MSEKKLLTDEELATVLNIPVRTLRNFRYRGGGPKFVKIGASVKYQMIDVEEWLNANKRESTSQPQVQEVPHAD
ncbi:MAG: helix-turn-helix domain-containing protein [Candidatus Obscuribacter phosphatis]|uniref:Helix-turn-helix domain-containing protein n=1 Tax=Candidatus Obscuribacter phosphatis TaxID=1906157 RepID=A0A8J7P8G2_9BACT|nr:helix-turn-helix domain-containing protein [Candidatus Obscuribacter phosphatis]